MTWLSSAVGLCLLVALFNDGLPGAIAEALGFAIVLAGALLIRRKRTQKASAQLLARARPGFYDKVL